MPILDVIDRFLATAAARPAHPATVLRGQVQTYAEFEHRVRDYAGAFSRIGGPAVLIALPQGPDAYAAIFGAALAGCYYAPLNLDVPIEKLLRIARLFRPDVIVGAPAAAGALAQAAPGAALLDPGLPLGPPLVGRGRRHPLAYVIFTSGTTGLPKGVMIGRGALDHFCDWVAASGTIGPDDRVAQFSNIAFDVSVTDYYGSLAVGATVYPVVGRADRTFPARIVARERLTVWNSTPSVVSLMMQAGEATAAHLGSLKLVNTCGEPLLRTHLEALFAAVPDLVVQNSYGPTETTVTMTELRLTRHNFEPACGSSVAIGSPIARMGVHLVGGAHPDEGEIVVTGPQVADGYWDDPERTAAAFRTVRIDGEAVRGYFSGDWAERRGPYMFFKERIDHQVKIRGHRLELGEVARAINDAGFPVACVLKWRDELAAVIERHPERKFDEAALRALLATVLEPHAIPTRLQLIDRIPRDQNDKLDRKAVAAWLDAQAGAA